MVRKTKQMKIRTVKRKQKQQLQEKDFGRNERLKIQNLLLNAKTAEDFVELGQKIVPEFIIETHIEWLNLDNGEQVDYAAIPETPKGWPHTMRQVLDRYRDFISYTANKFASNIEDDALGIMLTNLVKAIDILAYKIWTARLDAEEEEY